mmetsp:Transcript_21621/g.47063  ORF Transcript_21621/g.47063 Transcript_21621/m.47063 type:complete len:439 (+) Transcript_21621:259-1575(+)
MLLDPSAQGNLVALLSAHRAREGDLGRVVVLDAENLSSSCSRADVDHEDFALLQLGHLFALRVSIQLDAQQASEQVVLDLDFDVDVGELVGVAQDHAHKTVRTRERGVDLGADADEAAGHRELEVVRLGREGDDLRSDGLAGRDVVLGVPLDDAGPNLDVIPYLEDTSEDGSASNTTLQLIDLFAGSVHVEGSNDDHGGVGSEISGRDGNLSAQVLTDDVQVVLEHSTNGDDRSAVGRCACHELLDFFVLGLCLLLLDQLYLVLENDDVLKAHDFDGCQVLSRLRLRAGLVACDKQKGRVHDGGSVQHGSHENIVTRAVNEGDMSHQPPIAFALIHRDDIWEGRPERSVTRRCFDFRIVGLVDFGIGVAELDGDVSFLLLLELNGGVATKALDDSGLTMCHVSDSAYVHGSLSADDLRCQRSQCANVQLRQVLQREPI